MAAGNRSISQKGTLAKTLTLKLESKIMDKVDIIYITFDDINVGKKTGTGR